MGDPVETELEMAERHVRRGEIIIEQQRLLVQRIAKAGGSTVDARGLLAVVEVIQAEHLIHLARVMNVCKE